MIGLLAFALAVAYADDHMTRLSDGRDRELSFLDIFHSSRRHFPLVAEEAIADKCPKLPPFSAGAMDARPLDFPLLRSTPQDTKVKKMLLNRSDEAPWGHLLRNVSLRSGVLLNPPAGVPEVDLSRFDRVLRGAVGHTTNRTFLTVLVLGGSMTAGHMSDFVSVGNSSCAGALEAYSPKIRTCTRTFNSVNFDCRPCAFPARLERWLKVAYPHRHVRVLNHAVGGMGTSACVGQLGGMLQEVGRDVDVVLLNFVHNDMAKVGNFAVKEAKAETVSLAEADLMADHETLLRTLLTLPRQPAVLEIELYRPPGHEQMPLSSAYRPHAEVLNHYRVPTLAWQTAAGHLGVAPAGEVHPAWPWHQLMADWLAYAWARLAKHACSTRSQLTGAFVGLPPRKWVPRSASCSRPRSFLLARALPLPDSSVATATPLPKTVNSTGNWNFSEDAPGKLAWWIDSASGGSIVFPVNISNDAPKIGMGFLSSWNPSMGAVQVSVLGDPPGVFAVVNGSNSQGHISIPVYQELCAMRTSKDDGAAHTMPFCGQPRVQCCMTPDCLGLRRCSNSAMLHNLRVELKPRTDAPRNKFAIRYISTC